jgi:polar amino acid transport system substrate-binding protein
MSWRSLTLLFTMIVVIIVQPQRIVAIDKTISNTRHVTVAVDPALPPFQFKENESLKGFSIDIFETIANELGLTYEYIFLPHHQAIEALKNEQVDVILTVPYNDVLSKDILFSDHYFTSSSSLYVAYGNSEIQSVEDLSERTVSLVQGSIEYDFLQNIRRIKFQVASNQKNALRLLTVNRSDAFIGEPHTANYFINQWGLEDKYKVVQANVVPVYYSFVLRQDEAFLLHQINEELSKLRKNGVYQHIMEKWFEPYQWKRKVEHTIHYLTWSLVIVLVVIVFISVWNRKLQKEVQKQTNALQQQVLETKNNIQFKQQILDSSPRGILTFDRSGALTSINQKASLIIGKANLDMKRNIYTEIPLINKLLDTTLFNQVIRHGEKILGKEFNWELSENKIMSIRYYIYPLYNYKSEIIGLILSFEDISLEKYLREQFFEQEKSRALNQLVAGIAHEIRNPLTSIQTLVHLIPYKMSNEEFKKELVNIVPKEIERINQLVEGLINYVKPKKSKSLIEIRVHDLIHSITILFKRVLEQKGIDFHYHHLPPVTITCDENQLKQALMNFILNSIDAIEERKKIEVGHYQPKIEIFGEMTLETCIINIKDNGMGIKKENLDKVYEPFFTTKATGTGLGMSISKQYIQEQNGTVQVKSKYGEGTQITIAFPLTERGYYGKDSDN